MSRYGDTHDERARELTETGSSVRRTGRGALADLITALDPANEPAIDPARVFTPARRAQGFRDQAHLDRFYASRDHRAACTVCGQPGPGYDAPDGWQPTEQICPEGTRLLNAAR